MISIQDKEKYKKVWLVYKTEEYKKVERYRSLILLMAKS